jgi:hypothetical protein
MSLFQQALPACTSPSNQNNDHVTNGQSKEQVKRTMEKGARQKSGRAASVRLGPTEAEEFSEGGARIDHHDLTDLRISEHSRPFPSSHAHSALYGILGPPYSKPNSLEETTIESWGVPCVKNVTDPTLTVYRVQGDNCGRPRGARRSVQSGPAGSRRAGGARDRHQQEAGLPGVNSWVRSLGRWGTCTACLGRGLGPACRKSPCCGRSRNSRAAH